MPEAIPYDPSRQALYRPGTQPTLPLTHDWPLDPIAAEFSRLAYRRFESDPQAENEIERAVGAIGYDQCGWFTNPDEHGFDAQGFAAINGEKQAIIAFRGTEADSFIDLVNDASFILKNWNGPGRVHSGFWGSLQTILDPVQTWLGKVSPAHIVVTGHSLGAALATLLAARLEQAELVNFGSPRVGDAEFAASFAGRPVRRYVDCTDIVTEVPPPLDYGHLDGLRYIDRRGTVHAGEQSAIWLLEDHAQAHLAFAPLMWRAGNVHLRKFADHAPINYVSAVLGVRTGP